ncbi:UNVERIFIED_CONTAM: hypothetical protein HHA_451440 [Hammondia hammondi]|eukprot:XP_008884254.1 hypothetical protein HHA_451440 [Hammondia hammondi]
MPKNQNKLTGSRATTNQPPYHTPVSPLRTRDVPPARLSGASGTRKLEERPEQCRHSGTSLSTANAAKGRREKLSETTRTWNGEAREKRSFRRALFAESKRQWTEDGGK